MAVRFPMHPVGTNSAASFPKISAARFSSWLTVGSSPYTSSPTSATAIARRISGVGRVTSSTPQKLHSKHSIFAAPAGPRCHLAPPNPPTSADRIAPSPSLHTPARFAPHQSHPTAATQETTPPPARAPPSAFHDAQWAILRPAPPSHNLRHHARSPTAPSPKTNAPQPQIPEI